MCSLLNEEHQKMFNFIMRYSQELQLNKRNDLPDPNPFHIFLSGGAGVGKSFLTKVITERMKKTLKIPGQNMAKHPTVLVTASTGKTAINVNGITLHFAFGLPVRENITFTQLAWDKKDNFLKKYVNPKALLVDKISMILKLTFNHLNVNMRKVFDEDGILNLDFSGKSLLVIGDFQQLPSSG